MTKTIFLGEAGEGRSPPSTLLHGGSGSEPDPVQHLGSIPEAEMCFIIFILLTVVLT